MQAVSVASQTSLAGGGAGGGGNGLGGGGGEGGGGTICGVQTAPPFVCIHVQPSLQWFTVVVVV